VNPKSKMQKQLTPYIYIALSEFLIVNPEPQTLDLKPWALGLLPKNPRP